MLGSLSCTVPGLDLYYTEETVRPFGTNSTKRIPVATNGYK